MIKLSTRACNITILLKTHPNLWKEYEHMHGSNLVDLYERLHLLALSVACQLKYGSEADIRTTLLEAVWREKEIHKEYRRKEREFIKEHSDNKEP